MAKQILTNLDFNSVATCKNLPTPVSPGDAVNMAYVDSIVEGMAWKDNVVVASVSNINIAAPGATIDGVTMTTNDRVLLKDQTSVPTNGIYIFNGAATPMTRSLDASTFAELHQAVVTVDSGTSAGTAYRQTQIGGVIETNDIIWGAFGTVAPPGTETVAGILEIATQTETNTGTDDTRAITPLKLKNSSLIMKRFSQLIGDGTSTSYTVTHNLNTREISVRVYRNSGAYDEVIVDTESTTLNTATIGFAAAPSSNAFNVVVIA